MSAGLPVDPSAEPSLATSTECRVGPRRGFIGGLISHVPPGQLSRFLLVGIWNTVFGFGTFAAFTALLQPIIPYSYMAATVLAALLNITVAFLGYKWFVFKTKGNYVREWARCLLVYSGSIALGLMLLPLFVWMVTVVTARPKAAPYIAGVIVMGINATVNFLGQKRLSFRS